MATIVYRNGGSVHVGDHSDQNLSYWNWTGRQKKQKYMYKGYMKPRLYSKDDRRNVVVFDNVLWSPTEVAKRKANGFMGIRVYRISSTKNPILVR
jgi:hypothetical protein